MFAAPAAEITEIEWDEIQARNAKLPFLLSQQVLPRMAAKEYGRVVNVVSELAERGMINGSAFAASQAALLSLTRSLAVEWGTRNIRINALGTGWIDVRDQAIEVQQEELLVRYTPLRPQGPPPGYRAVAGLSVFRVLRLLHRPAGIRGRGPQRPSVDLESGDYRIHGFTGTEVLYPVKSLNLEES